MNCYFILISLTLVGHLNAVITKRSNRDQQNFQHYEIQTFGTSNPVNNIIQAITTPLNILTDRLTRQPGAQLFNPGFEQYGPPGHRRNPGHHGPHDHHGNRGQQQNNPFHYPQQPLPPFLNNFPSQEQLNSQPMKINPQNPFLNQNPTFNSAFQGQPGTQFPQGQVPQRPNFFAFGQNYPKPGQSNFPGNANGNKFNNNGGNRGCIGFCPPSQPQQPNQFDNDAFNNNNFGVSPNNAQNNNGFGTRPQENGLIQSTFGGFGTDGSQTQQSRPGNQFGSGGFNNNNFGGSPNSPQANNAFGTQNKPSQENDLIQSTFGGFGGNGNQTPQSQPGNQFGNSGLFNNNNFGGSSNIPQVNNGFVNQNRPSQGSDLIQTTFAGFGSDGNQLNNQNGQTNKGDVSQPSKTPENDGLISSVFGDRVTERPQINNQQNPSSNFDSNGTPSSQPQLNDTNDLISSIFAGLPENPQTNNNNANNVNTAQGSNPSGGNDLIETVFSGFTTLPTPVNNLQPITQMNPQSKDNNDLIESIFAGINNGNGQNAAQVDAVGTTTIPPSTTNSNGFIYDIDVRSS